MKQEYQQQIPDLSIVIACYCEEATLNELHDRLTAALDPLDKEVEFIYVNDGSTDRTLEVLEAIHARDPRVTVIDLFRNAGQWPAMTAGICHSRGRAIAFLDSDLQLDPADLSALIAKYDEGYELVSGCRIARYDTFIRKCFSRMGNYLLKGITKGRLHDLGCSMKVFNANYVRAFEFGPMTPFRPLQVVASMGHVAEVSVRHQVREHGQSNWGSGVLVKNFSLAALDLLQGRMRIVGIRAMCFALTVAVLSWLLSRSGVIEGMGLAYLAAAIFLLGQMLVICELLILSVITRRVKPAYVVRRIYSHGKLGAEQDD